jgi:hypothetical protein
MRTRTITIIAATLIVVASVIAYKLSPPTQAARDAADQLKTAKALSLGGGYAGQILEEEDNLFVVLSSHRAADLLSEVFDVGTPEAKAYALCGLHYISPARFELYAGQFAAEKVIVRTLGGCISGQHEATEVVAELRKNLFERYLPLRKGVEDRRQEVKGSLSK